MGRKRQAVFWQKGESMYLSEMDLLKARLTAEGRLSQSRILQDPAGGQPERTETKNAGGREILPL